jgi:hypothetical protein
MRTLRIATASAVIAAGAMLPATAVASAQGNDLDCSDFSTHQAAQQEFESHSSDIYRLDADNDGIACESLPSGASQPTGNEAANQPATNNEENNNTATTTNENNGTKGLPAGAPETGGGATAGTDNAGLIVGGGIALTGAAAAGAYGIRETRRGRHRA